MSKALISLFLLGVVCLTSVAAFNAPIFSQHDSRWGYKTLGEGPYTISQEGCFMTTITSMASYKGVTIAGQKPTPSTMNTWLRNNNWFDGGILFYKCAQAFGFRYEGIVTSMTSIKNAMNAGKFAHLHVLNGRHWVLATGLVSGGFTAMDPGYGKIRTVKYSEVVGSAIYSYTATSPRRLSELTEGDADVEVEGDADYAVDIDIEIENDGAHVSQDGADLSDADGPNLSHDYAAFNQAK